MNSYPGVVYSTQKPPSAEVLFFQWSRIEVPLVIKAVRSLGDAKAVEELSGVDVAFGGEPEQPVKQKAAATKTTDQK